MRIDLKGASVRLTLDGNELPLLRYALERASFIDTPASEQPKIAAFCSKLLELLRSLEGTEPPA